MTYLQAIILGLVQGISELFPISSLGHSVILPRLLGWSINQSAPFFLSFLVATHLATAVVLFCFFWRDWMNIIKALGRSLVRREIKVDDYYAKLGWLLVLGTIPAGILGLLFQDKLQTLFASARAAAGFLILNGVLLYGAELLRRRSDAARQGQPSYERIAKLTWRQGFFIGVSQTIALIPGFSRSGSTMAGGLLAGLSHEDAARFSFLLATPIIAAAAVLKLPSLNGSQFGITIAGAACAALAAYFSVTFLLKFFKTNKITPLAAYCFFAGIIYSVILYLR